MSIDSTKDTTTSTTVSSSSQQPRQHQQQQQQSSDATYTEGGVCYITLSKPATGTLRTAILLHYNYALPCLNACGSHNTLNAAHCVRHAYLSATIPQAATLLFLT
jgi:hypothetical protein